MRTDLLLHTLRTRYYLAVIQRFERNIKWYNNFNGDFMEAKSLILKMLTVGLCAICFSSSAAQRGLPVRLLGESVPSNRATRTIVIKPNTKYVRVVSGETVKFISGQKDFTWHFDGPGGKFSLAEIAPNGMLNRTVKGYIDPNPLYRGE